MNQYIKSIIEGFNFGNVKGNASQNITKVLQKEISIKNLLVNKYKISDDIVTNEYTDEIYEDKDSQGYNYLQKLMKILLLMQEAHQNFMIIYVQI